MTAWVRRLPALRPQLSFEEHWPVAAAILLAAAMGWQLGQGKLSLGLAALGALLVIAISTVAWLPLLVVVLAGATFADFSAFPQIAIPGPDPYLSELVFFAAVGAWAISPGARHAFAPAWRKAALSVVVLLGAVVAGAFIGISDGAEASEAIGATRPMLFYAVFFPAVAAFRIARTRVVALWLLGLAAALVVALQILQGLLGASTIVFYVNDPLLELLTCPDAQCANPGATGYPRVRPPGMPLVYAACIFAGAYILWGPRRHRLLAVGFFGLTVLGILISLNRNMLVGVVLGLGIATLLTPSRARVGVALIALTVVSATAIVLVRSSSGSGNVLADRVLSLADVGGIVESGTFRDRVRENEFALEAIRRQPLTGIGWGTSFGEKMTVRESDRLVVRDQDFIHQQYLGLWLRTGLTGILAYLAAVGIALVAAARALRSGTHAWLAAGVLASLVAFSFSATAMILLMKTSGIVVVATLVALAVTLRREDPQRAETSA